MADYTIGQIRAMQEDAARRVREMNRRSKSTVEHINETVHNRGNSGNGTNHGADFGGNAHENMQHNVPHKKAVTPPAAHKNPLNFLQSLDLKQLISGGEESMLLLLILILMSDNSGDDFLIYALIYIML